MREALPPKMYLCGLVSRRGLYVWHFEQEKPPLGQTVFFKVRTDASGNTLWCTLDHEGPCEWPGQRGLNEQEEAG